MLGHSDLGGKSELGVEFWLGIGEFVIFPHVLIMATHVQLLHQDYRVMNSMFFHFIPFSFLYVCHFWFPIASQFSFFLYHPLQE